MAFSKKKQNNGEGRHASSSGTAAVSKTSVSSSNSTVKLHIENGETDAQRTLVLPQIGTESEEASLGLNTSGSFVPPVFPEGDKKKSSLSYKKVFKIIGISLASLLGLCVLAYAGVAFFFYLHFYPDFKVLDTDLSLKSTSDATAEISDFLDTYTLTITGDYFNFELDASKLEGILEASQVVDVAHSSMNCLKWPQEFRESYRADDAYGTAIDSDALLKLITEQVEAYNEGATPPENATIVYDKESKSYKVEYLERGTQVDPQIVFGAVYEALSNLAEELELDKSFLLEPEITAHDEQLIAAMEEANGLLERALVLTLGDTEICSLDPDTISSWIEFTEEKDNITVGLNADSLSEWAQQLASSYNTVGASRTYTRPDGKKCSVEGGSYGWAIDTSKLSEQLSSTLYVLDQDTLSIPTTSEAARVSENGAADWSSRYIDADLSEQHVYFYDKNGTLVWESDCVSGTPNAKRATPTGVFYITGKQSPSTLIGYTDEGEIDYETPVSYWMPFKGNSVGFHDATWQYAFGGTRYKDGYGSHGCINLPLSSAKELYNLLEIGDVVVVHW